MKITPNPALIAGLAGRIGGLVLQPLRSHHIARRAWTIRAPATDAQTAHRSAVANAGSLWASVSADLYPAWLPYAARQGYGPFAAWQHLNILPVKNDDPTALTPPNPEYVPITNPDWHKGARARINATWSYAGPPATVWVETYYRPTPAWSWIHDATTDATEEARTISGLIPGAVYEVGLVAHDTPGTLFAQAYHERCEAGSIAYEDFLTYTELDTHDQIEVEKHAAHAVSLQRERDAWLYGDYGEAHFGATFTHDFQVDFTQVDAEAIGTLWALSNVVEDACFWWDNASQALNLHLYRPGSNHRVDITNPELALQSYFDDYDFTATYYWTVERLDETHLEARSYTDPDRTNLFHTHEQVVTDGRRFRYLFVINTWDSNGPNRCWYSVQDLNLHIGE